MFCSVLWLSLVLGLMSISVMYAQVMLCTVKLANWPIMGGEQLKLNDDKRMFSLYSIR